MSCGDPNTYENDVPDIVQPKIFVVSAILCIIFGCLVGAGFWITFASYHLTIDRALMVMLILFFAGAIPAVFLHWWQNRNLFGERE